MSFWWVGARDDDILGVINAEMRVAVVVPLETGKICSFYECLTIRTSAPYTPSVAFSPLIFV